MLLEKCICGSVEFETDIINEIPVAVCPSCEVVRQIVDMDEEQLSNWYSKYQEEIYTHDLTHDIKVAKTRLARYQITKDALLLDVGSGNGGFILQCLVNGIDAIGVDFQAEAAQHVTHIGSLYDQYFPTDHFDVITLHDVLEHVPDPIKFLKEIHRILKPHGRLIIDFPNFWVDAGKHHWKRVEHIWMFSPEHVKDLLLKMGFIVKDTWCPIASKVVFDVEQVPEQRISVMVPPGIGDSWWVYTKLEAFAKQNGIPDVYISSENSKLDRSGEFTSKFPFMHFAGYKHCNRRDISWRHVWNEAYMLNGRTVYPNVVDCDYFIAYNGITRYNRSLHEVDPQWPVNWYLPMYRSLNERSQQEHFKKKYGDYMIAYFIDQGMYSTHWLPKFTRQKIRQALEKLVAESGKTVLMIGAAWDMGKPMEHELSQVKGIVNLTGMTTMDDALALLRGCDGMLGFPSGISMLPTSFKKPTLLLWSDYFKHGPDFRWNCCPDDSWGKWYETLDVAGLTPEVCANKMMEMMQNDY